MSIITRALQEAQSQRAGAAPEGPRQVDPVDSAERPETAVELHAPSDTGVSSRHSGPSAVSGTRIVIDSERLRAAGRLAPVESSQLNDDEIRRIKWPIVKSIAGVGGKPATRNSSVLVTSAFAGEGKTFIALSLALSIARDRDLQVILVDGDVARPGLTPALGLEGEPGLNDVLDDADRDIDSVICPTSVEGLSVVPAGQWFEHSPELFSSRRMKDVIDALCRRASPGCVIIDSPPLLATNEAQAITRLVGQVLLVVQADQTEQRAVKEALALVDQSTPVNAVLNKVEPSVLTRFYGHYYYGYGYYGSGSYGRGSSADVEKSR